MRKLKYFYKEWSGGNIISFSRKRIIVLSLLIFTFHCSLLTLAYSESPQRIISLAPSTTEILFATGLGEKIVGVTNYCDYPEKAKEKPKIGGMSNPSLEAVLSLKPDIVIMTTDGNPKEFEQKLHSLNMKTFVFKSLTVPELPDEIMKMGNALGEKEKFNNLASDIKLAIEKFMAKKNADKKRILFIVWPEPLIVAGPRTAVDDAIKLIGGINIAQNAKGRYPKFSIEEIFRQSPDFIFIGKGKGMDDVSRGLLKRLKNVGAVKNRKVFFVSDSLYRLGPRVIEGIEELAGYINGSN